MEHEVDYDFEDEGQFWTVLDETLSRDCNTHSNIDDILRCYLGIISACRERFLPTEYDLGRCALKLQDSTLFAVHADYIRRQFVQSLVEDDEPDVVLVSTSFLIADAQLNEHTYELLNDEGAFPRLVDLIASPKQHGHEGIHRLLMELLYEMSRIQKIKINDLAHINDDFIRMLFEIIEQVSDDVDDPYHYPTIRVLLVLNEQFMVAAHDPESNQIGVPLTNKVIKVLSAHGSAYKTFGENIILLLNREDETSLQLLTLKLLYLLFTTPLTYEYFYTNDLRVLVDILIRNLLDLPEEAISLRHTYLRVLYPLLEHTQLQYPPHYKRDEIRKLLLVLGGGQLTDHNGKHNSLQHWGHFDDVDETTKRLVKRCEGVSWLTDPEADAAVLAESPTDDAASDLSSPTSPSKGRPPALPAPRKLTKRNSSKASTLTIGQYLTPHLEGARQSSLSMMEVAAQREKPGVITPSRNPSLKQNLRAAIMHKKEKPPPPPPQARRSGWQRPKMQGQTSEAEVAQVGSGALDSQSGPGIKLAAEQQKRHHIPHLPLPHSHLRQHLTLSTTENAKEKPAKSPEPPPIPSHHKGHFKKPPPAPKARRWRKESGGPSGTREPGKFNTNLPSIVRTTTTGEKIPEQSPFSPTSSHDTILSPPEPDSSGSSDQDRKRPVSQALEEAQAQALEHITETLDHVGIAQEPKSVEKDKGDTSEEIDPEPRLAQVEETDLEVDDEDPEVARSVSQEDLDQPFHDAVLNQSRPASETRSHASLSPVPENQKTDPTKTVVPGTFLTPPAQKPTRGVPGPQWALERSPFLTDEEVEGEDSDKDNDHD